MKNNLIKVIALSLFILPITNTYANLKTEPVKIDLIKEAISEDELVIKNNNITQDYDYNRENYFTTKIKANKLFIPESLKSELDEIYFIAEEGNRMYLYKGNSLMDSESAEITDVEKTYNFRKIEFNQIKDEYIFNNSDLVDDFKSDKNRYISISLMGKNKDGKLLTLSNSLYLNINSKESTLNSMVNTNNYYNNGDHINEYLKELSENIDRSKYLDILVSANNKLENLTNENKDNMIDLIDNIEIESDINDSVKTFKEIKENSTLIGNLKNIIIQEISRIKTLNIIDSILIK